MHSLSPHAFAFPKAVISRLTWKEALKKRAQRIEICTKNVEINDGVALV